jgi:hypothetical protein
MLQFRKRIKEFQEANHFSKEKIEQTSEGIDIGFILTNEPSFHQRYSYVHKNKMLEKRHLTPKNMSVTIRYYDNILKKTQEFFPDQLKNEFGIDSIKVKANLFKIKNRMSVDCESDRINSFDQIEQVENGLSGKTISEFDHLNQAVFDNLYILFDKKKKGEEEEEEAMKKRMDRSIIKFKKFFVLNFEIHVYHTALKSSSEEQKISIFNLFSKIFKLSQSNCKTSFDIKDFTPNTFKITMNTSPIPPINQKYMIVISGQNFGIRKNEIVVFSEKRPNEAIKVVKVQNNIIEIELSFPFKELCSTINDKKEEFIKTFNEGIALFKKKGNKKVVPIRVGTLKWEFISK